ncbi:MAG TPA: Gfo/Idh/MocA family oxidoreductase [Candidatus Aquilonibacter sp.]|jgi:predicted dehydrogenase|nr:Gfo/Idh/MocA family oxidoreductase [Candidatus Aquilonibacter sp.]
MRSFTRRDFMRIGSGSVAAGAAMKWTLLQPAALWGAGRQVAPSDRVRFASIGTGTRGCELLTASLAVPGIECVAVCDLYDSRHEAAQEAVQKQVPATRNYKEILDRKDVDAVIVAVPDHQHRPIVMAACAAGKDVYCEKPMSHNVEDGLAMVEAVQKHNRILQVGSQRVSSIVYEKARELYSSGALGEVFFIEGYSDRNSASGAWVYPIPPDASEQTIDWNAFLGDAPKRPFDAARFFRWRCFSDYGEGLAGDLFVHLLSGIYFISGTNEPPQRAQSSGGLFRWKDGRDFPDLIETLFDYPKFRVVLRSNLNNAGGEPIRFHGTKGTMEINGQTLVFTPQDASPKAEEYSTKGWPARLRKQYLEQWAAEHPQPSLLDYKAIEAETFTAPPGYSDVSAHQANFFAAVRSRKPTVENEVFGNNAAIGCHLANHAYFKNTIATWDAGARKIRG